MSATPQRRGAPLGATVILMVLGWLLMLVPLPLTSLLAAPLLIIALITGVICIARERVLGGLILLLLNVLLSPVIWLLGVIAMLVLFGSTVGDLELPRELPPELREWLRELERYSN